MNRAIAKLTDSLNKDGFRWAILKGQGNALMYPDPLNRQPGDIDVWAIPQLKMENGKLKIGDIIRYVKTKNPQAHAMYVTEGQVPCHWVPCHCHSPIQKKSAERLAFFVESLSQVTPSPLTEGQVLCHVFLVSRERRDVSYWLAQYKG